MSSVKKAIKSIKSHIENREPESAVYEATELLKTLDPKQPEAVQVLIYRGLALTQTGNKDEAEKCYLHAYRISPGHELAEKGLRKLYEKEELWDKYGKFMEKVVQHWFDQEDAEKCATALQDLLELRSNHGPEEALYRTLQLLLPSSPLVPILQTLPAPQGSYTPFPSPIYPPASFAVLPSLPKPLPHALHLLSSLPLLLNLLIRSQGLVHQDTEVKVKAARQRIGAGPEREVRKKTEAEVLTSDLGSEMVDLLREAGAHPAADEATRRDVEVREFTYWRKLVGSLHSENSAQKAPKETKVVSQKAVSMISSMISTAPKPKKQAAQDPDTPPLFRRKEHTVPTKKEALSRTNSLADGFVLLNIASSGAEEAWVWVIEGKDESTLFYDIELLHKFARAFPQSSLTDFIDDYCRWFHLPLPEPEEETEAVEEKHDEPKQKKGKGFKRGKAAMNARDRRKARRVAGREGALNEDIDQEERDNLVGAMTKLLDRLPKSIFAHRVMARISIQEEDWANAIAYAEKGRTLLKELEGERGNDMKNVRMSLETALGVALVPYFPPKHHSRASRLLTGVIDSEPTNSEARFARAQIFETAGQWQEARDLFQSILDQGGDDRDMVAAREEVAWCLVNEGKLTGGRDILEEVVEMRDSKWEESGKEDEALPRARAWWRLGKTEWMIGDEESKTNAQEWFMASARALPSYAPAYSSLGTCYQEASPPDTERALKCFQKAFELDATEADAARLLAQGYADDDEWALVRGIATRVMEGEGGVEGVAGGEALNAKGRFAPKNGWAWKALGSTEMHYRQYAKAAAAYQIALRADPDDVTTWLQLGEAYVRCGRHTAGLKTLQHALELEPNSWMAMYDIGDTYLQVGSFDLAVETFEKVLSITGKEEVGVVAKLADTLLSQGRYNASGGFRERSRNAFRAAITLAGDVLRMAVGHRPWAWKVVGDAAFEIASQESTMEEVGATTDVLYPVLQLLVEDDSDRRSAVEGLGHAANLLQSPVDLDTTLKGAVFAYAYRAYLLKNETRVADPALYDLASALHALASRLVSEEKTACVKAAIKAIRSALERDAGDERLWNALGVICAESGAQIAQHAFVVSLELYTKDPEVWINLGYLYLRLDDRDLANQCFLKAQIMDPDCAKAWLGQGLLADLNGDKDHARALFAHSVTLSAGSLLEADLAQAVSAFLPLVNAAVDTSLLHAPAFALRHYTHQRTSDASALHLYALLCERLGLVDEASVSLERAVSLLEEEFESSESAETERAYCIALANLGRVRLAADQHDKALEAYTSVWELVGSLENDNITSRLKVQSKLGQALAHSCLKNVDQSLDAFQAALNVAATGSAEKNDVAVLLARTLWGLGGEEAKETAKTHLMECLSQDAPPIAVINTLAAVALVSSDSDLLEAAISELQTIPAARVVAEDPESHVPLVLSTNALVSSQPEEAISALQTALHMVPTDLVTRNRLAKLLIANEKVDEAVELLNVDLGKDTSAKSEGMRLRGIAKILAGGEGGLSDLMGAVRICPWDVRGMEGVAWGRKILDELKE